MGSIPDIGKFLNRKLGDQIVFQATLNDILFYKNIPLEIITDLGERQGSFRRINDRPKKQGVYSIKVEYFQKLQRFGTI